MPRERAWGGNDTSGSVRVRSDGLARSGDRRPSGRHPGISHRLVEDEADHPGQVIAPSHRWIDQAMPLVACRVRKYAAVTAAGMTKAIAASVRRLAPEGHRRTSRSAMRPATIAPGMNRYPSDTRP